MTFPRKLALRISGFAARHASPGWKDWAEGMAREVDYVKGDWAALAWALGSLRVLFEPREAPICSLTQVPALARKFVENARKGTSMMAALPMLPMPLGGLYKPANWQQDAVCGLSLLSMAICFALWRMDRLRLDDPADDRIYESDVQSAVLYRDELERNRFTMWPPMCAWYSAVFGFLMNNWSWIHLHAWVFAPFAFFGLFGAWALWQGWRNNQSRIAQLDALLADKV
jgi:hypothetical protein